MQVQTLEELKRENAEAESNEEIEQPQLDEVSEQDDEQAQDDGGNTEEVAETESDNTPEIEQEAWMTSDDEASQDSEEQTIPLKAHIKKRNKLQGERDDLKKEIDELKARLDSPSAAATESQTPAKKIPTLEDFEYDEAKFSQAMAEYHSQNVQDQILKQQQASQQQAQSKAQKASIDKSVDQHYSRAEAMLKTSGINAEVYKASEVKVREVADSIFPGEGDQTIDTLIDTIGEGSEKVIYALGRKPQLLAEFESALRSNPFKAVALLSKKAAEFSAPSKRKSTAPAPAKQINSDTSPAGGKSEQRKYKAAHDSGDQGKAFSIKMEAKRAGVDVSKW